MSKSTNADNAILSISTKDIDRFWGFVRKSNQDECWVWLGAKSQQAYGHFVIQHTCTRAHRVSFYIHNGHLPQETHHICKNPSCVNPHHLLSMSSSEHQKETYRIGQRGDIDNRPMRKYPELAKRIADKIRGKNHFTHKYPEITRKWSGDKNGMAKISDSDVGDIFSLRYNKGMTVQKIANMYGLGHSQISNILLAKTRKDVTRKFYEKYAENKTQ